MASTRLQKLLNLLEGQNDTTRKAASKQICEIARAHPSQLVSVSRKVHALLYNKNWDTRIAAAETLGLLACAFPHHDVADLLAAAGSTGCMPKPSLAFARLDLQHVLDKGTPLLSSGGQEFECPDDTLTPAERLAKQRSQLKRRLGLGNGLDTLIETDDLVEDEDIAAAIVQPRPKASDKQQAAELLGSLGSLSARERNRLKRKAKALNRTDSNPLQGTIGQAAAKGADSGDKPLSREGSVSSSQGLSDEQSADADLEEWKSIESGVWPFQRLCDRLCVDILDPAWEVRHGAAVALREVMRSQAAAAAVESPVADATSGWCCPGGAGKRQLAPTTLAQAQAAAQANSSWLEDCIILLLCVLALDRFADYVLDQVVVPVRETAAQALAAVIQPVDVNSLKCILNILQALKRHDNWHVRHGAFTGIKYVLASRPEAAEELLPLTLPALLEGLQDSNDDIQAAAAQALVPMAPAVMQLGTQAVEQLRSILWHALASMEELSAAISSTMTLLASLYNQPGSFRGTADLACLLPRLWPFLRHALTSVRYSSMQCLEGLVSASTASFLEQKHATSAASHATSAASHATSAADHATSAADHPASAAEHAADWLKPVLGPCLRLVFQNMIMESDARVQAVGLQTWQALLQHTSPALVLHSLNASDIQTMMTLASTPVGQPLDPTLLLVPCDGRLLPMQQPAVNTSATQRPLKRLKSEPSAEQSQCDGVASCSGYDPEQLVGCNGQEAANKMRMMAAEALGLLCNKFQQQDSALVPALLLQQLQQPSASSRLLAGMTLCCWVQLVHAQLCSTPQLNGQLTTTVKQQQQHPAVPTPPSTSLATAIAEIVPVQLAHFCLQCLSAPGPCNPCSQSTGPYAEVQPMYVKLRKEVVTFLSACLKAGWKIHTPNSVPIEQLTSEGAIAMLATVPAEADSGEVATAKLAVHTTASHLQMLEVFMHCAACLAMAAAVVHTGQLPPKLNVIIQNLMHPLRKEPSPLLQQLGAKAVAELMMCCADRQPSPNDKVLKNLCHMACGDPAETPVASESQSSEDQALEDRKLSNGQAKSSTAAHSAPSPPAAAAAPTAPAADAGALAITRRGAEAALRAMCSRFGPTLFQSLPFLWMMMSAPLCDQPGGDEAGPPGGEAQAVLSALQIVKVVVPSLHASLVPQALQLLPQLCACCRHSNAAVRLAAARCAATLASCLPDRVLPPVLKKVVPLLDGSCPAVARMGAVEMVAQLVTMLQTQLVPYTVLLVVPLLRCMSDSAVHVRTRAATCFGALIALLPLAHGCPLPDTLDAEQRATCERDGEFLSQLLDNKKVEGYKLPVQLKVELRHYQQEGINWLAFLRRFGLHGVLADDMGLGKTLQATTIIACSTAEHANTGSTARQSGSADTDMQNHSTSQQSSSSKQPAMPCLVVCPSTLVAHWAHEINKYVDVSVLNPLQIAGSPNERAACQKRLPQHNVAIISYESLRADVDWASSISWDYVILDEGHVIRSTKSKLTQAVKRLSAQHRLILSGTPIQNNALELWSLFDFLMPGFLGAEKDFNARYSKVVQAARYSKKGSKESDAGLLALDALHKQVMPFVLRRTKQQVLHDLPPKIITDVVCELSPFQHQLYEDFAQSQVATEVVGSLKKASTATDAESSKPPGHVFQALLYLRKLCSHPLLAIDWGVPAHRQAAAKLLSASSLPAAQAALRAPVHAPKLLALKDILVQCGIVSGVEGFSDAGGDLDNEGSDSGHRVLVFAQLKGMLDIVERDLLQPLGVTFLRLDGSVDGLQRFQVVQRFNADPTIQVLLLTTHVGGLGLNLTSADTVVFLEHDWNPMKDLQAMDRAHRIGQTRTVNVYRLLMRDTLEERIMGLQQFKIDVANAVVNQDNMSLSAMDTGQLLDLFAAPSNAAAAAGGKAAAAPAEAEESGTIPLAASSRKKSALQTMLDSMGELWDESQYEQQFDVKSFMQKLAK